MLSPEDRASIESVLRRTLEAAREKHNNARHELQRAVDDIPSGIPAPDGGARIHAAASSERYAGRAYQVAMRRLYDYLMDGAIPEDFESGCSGAGDVEAERKAAITRMPSSKADP
ncbi:MAG: hypothetical protein LAP39_19075 [Acidobacteriia bacterium]|nr:hypothetical protein [Terriglobia bacterium]